MMRVREINRRASGLRPIPEFRVDEAQVKFTKNALFSEKHLLMTRLHLKVVVSQLFSQNAYLAHLEGREDCLIVDPGFDTDPILEYVSRQRLTPAAILNTHGHADHIAGNEAMKGCWPEVPLVIGTRDAEKLTDPAKNLSRPFGIDLVSPPADRLLNEGDVFSGAGMDWEVFECPGHSIGHVIFLWRG